MVKNIKLVALSFITITLISCSNDKSQKVVNLTNLVWQDEFSVDGGVDSNKWQYDIGTGPNSDGWGNNELEYYTNRPENVKVEDGILHIIARKENYLGRQYTSGRLTTKVLFSQAYGRYEARIKMPWGKGIWPAFWLLGDNVDTVSWPDCGEIDIMEYRGQDPTRIVGSVHGPGYSGGEAISKYYTLPFDRFDNDFHVFGIEWGENYINYYVDNVLYNQITPADVKGPWVFNHPFYIILNLAVGGNFVGSPDSSTTFPQEMLVDYVRVYK
jgi:beta-glucanase (GH16 family)